MTSSPANPDTPDASQQQASTERAAPVPFYRRSFFWVLMGMLVGLILGLILFKLYGQKQPEPVPPATAEAETVKPNEMLEIQRAQNKGLEEEIQRLKSALKEDPCALPDVLRTTPDKAPVAPGYNPPAVLPGTPGQPATPVPPSGNATAPTPPVGNATAPATAAPAPNTVGELMDRATVFIVSDFNNQVGMGSGFFVAPGIIATNRHVVQGPGATVYVGNKALGGMHEARLIAFSNNESRDYALLSVPSALAAKAPYLQITDAIKRTDHVSAWGFPGYITQIDPKLAALAKGDDKSVPEVVFSDGVVNVILERNPPAILHSASISQGNSGGPLINGQGVVVGINTFIKVADKSNAQANIALPGKDLALFMKEHGVAASMPAK